MFTKTVYAMLAIVAVAGGVTAVTAMTIQTALADQGGQPNNSATSGIACDNAQQRHERFLDRDEGGNKGFEQSHTSTQHNNRGLESNAFVADCS